VLFNLSGFANARWIDDQEADITPLTQDDWPLETLSNDALDLMGPMTSIYKSYSIHNCQLALLGSSTFRISHHDYPLT
jgi:hypothetical protein